MPIKSLSSLTLLTLSLLLGGCSNIQKYQARYDQAQVTETSVAALHYRKLPLEEYLKADLGADGRAFDFGTGKAFYLGFEIPLSDTGQGVHLKSYP